MTKRTAKKFALGIVFAGFLVVLSVVTLIGFALLTPAAAVPLSLELQCLHRDAY